jgi:hypothetical protein
LKPGNAGWGKDPDFWCAFEDGEVKVMVMSLTTPDKIRNLQRMAYGPDYVALYEKAPLYVDRIIHGTSPAIFLSNCPRE